MIRLEYWKYNNLNCVVQININSLKTGKYHCKVNNTRKGPHISNTANRYPHSETNVTIGKLPFPLLSCLQSPRTIPTHLCKKPGQSFDTVSVKRDKRPQSHGQILTMPMFPLLLGSSPPFNWIKCYMNCILRCDDKATPRIPHRLRSE